MALLLLHHTIAKLQRSVLTACVPDSHHTARYQNLRFHHPASMFEPRRLGQQPFQNVHPHRTTHASDAASCCGPGCPQQHEAKGIRQHPVKSLFLTSFDTAGHRRSAAAASRRCPPLAAAAVPACCGAGRLMRCRCISTARRRCPAQSPGPRGRT